MLLFFLFSFFIITIGRNNQSSLLLYFQKSLFIQPPLWNAILFDNKIGIDPYPSPSQTWINALECEGTGNNFTHIFELIVTLKRNEILHKRTIPAPIEPTINFTAQECRIDWTNFQRAFVKHIILFWWHTSKREMISACALNVAFRNRYAI